MMKSDLGFSVESEVPITQPGRVSSTATLLFANAMSKSFGGQHVLRNVTVELRKGEVVLLRGNNGSGKTTLLNILTGHIPPDSGSIVMSVNGTREIFKFPRSRWQGLNPRDHFTPERIAHRGIGRTWQDIRLFSTLSLADNVGLATPGLAGERLLKLATAPKRVMIDDRAARQSAVALLHRLGLEGREESSADAVSLGQAKRVAIARALQGGAQVLFLDEPLAGLDRRGVTSMLELLRSLAEDRGVTLVIVEHALNIRRILELVSNVWTLADGGIAVQEPDAVNAELDEHHRTETDYFLTPLLRRDFVVARNEIGGGARLTVASRNADGSEPPVLEVKDLVAHRGRRLVIGREERGTVAGISFTLRRGELAILEAPNGWGKTTLLESLAGTIDISGGSIRIDGIDVSGSRPWDRSMAGVSLLQARQNVFESLTVNEAFRLCGTSVPPELRHLRNRRGGDLSGGERQRLAIRCARSKAAFKIALLDEPFAAFDAAAMESERAEIIRGLEQGAVLVALPSPAI